MSTFHRIICLSWILINILIVQVINSDVKDISVCKNELECENEMNTSVSTQISVNETELIDSDEWSLNSDVDKINRSTTTVIPAINKTPSPTDMSNFNDSIVKNSKPKLNLIQTSNIDSCICDLLISQCDVNCCCDSDCTEFDFTVFSHCSNEKPKKYDSHYCYTKNFIQKNNTKLILDRVADNLFCISYDNLPPRYSMSSIFTIENRKIFNDILKKELEKTFTWNETNWYVPAEINSSTSYHEGDVLWAIKENSLQPIELPQSGFTSHCTFQQSQQYLRDINSRCLQTILTKDNQNLFIETYNSLVILSHPIFANSTLEKSLINNCPANICIPVEVKYCRRSDCDTRAPRASCISGTCQNIVKNVIFTIIHNGTMGIQSFQASIGLGNFSKPFYQHFIVQYQWAGINRSKILVRSGNPGYLIGKPVIIGFLSGNATKNSRSNVHIDVNATNYFLTVPIGSKNGECQKKTRHIIDFGMNLRTKCMVFVKTSNFSIDSCREIHKEIIEIFFQQSLMNTMKIEGFKMYVSKFGNISDTNVSSWNQIILNELPGDKITFNKTNDRISCSGLLTSLRIDVLYTKPPRLDDFEIHKIVGIGMNISREPMISWSKCQANNCTDNLKIDLVTYVQFHDISTPDTYYADGPNLDINLPYDFFYPFMSGSSSRMHINLTIFILGITLNTCF